MVSAGADSRGRREAGRRDETSDDLVVGALDLAPQAVLGCRYFWAIPSG